MKAIKYLLIGALATGLHAPLKAQDNKATIDAISKVIKENPAAAKDQVKEVFKKNKKNAEVLAGIGRAYYEAKDTANAKVYANLAIKANKNYAQGYILLGDLEVLKDDGGAAASWYQQAIYFDPKEPEGYFKYANIYRGRSPEEAVAKLNDLRTQRPDIAVDALAARILYSSNRLDQSLQYYDKVADKNKLEDVDITNYATEAWMLQKRDKSLEMAKYGLTRNPRKAAWNRLAFYNLTDMEQTAEALKYADALFNASDSAKLSGFDYTYYGTALKNDKQYDKAIEMFKKAMEENKDNAELLNSNRKSLSDLYLAKEDFEQATTYYAAYLENASKKTASDMAGLATIYMNMASKQTGDKQKETLKKADEIYAQLGENFPANIDFANFMRARINSNLDPETKEGLAKPFYEAIVTSLADKADRDRADTARLMEAYRYLGYYYLVKNDKATADGYWNKLLAIDPNNETAKQALGIK
jgi:tetratricopeptide repeat family protein